MKKSEFKKELAKENKSLKTFRKVGVALIILYFIILVATNLLFANDFMTVDTYLSIMVITIVAVVIPSIVIDVQNDIQIRRLYKEYQEENKKGEYIDKSGGLKIIVVIEIVLIVLFGAYIFGTNALKDNQEVIKGENEIVNNQTNTTNTKETKLVNIGEYSINVPEEFEVMSDDMIGLKYPNGNPPTIVYTNTAGTVNVACNDRSIEMDDSQLEGYVEIFQNLLGEVTGDMKIDYIEREDHKFASIEFTSQAVDTEIYNHMVLFTLNGYLRIVSFNSTPEHVAEWQSYSDSLVDLISFD